MCVGLQAARREERYEEGVEQLRRQGLHEKAVLLEQRAVQGGGLPGRRVSGGQGPPLEADGHPAHPTHAHQNHAHQAHAHQAHAHQAHAHQTDHGGVGRCGEVRRRDAAAAPGGSGRQVAPQQEVEVEVEVEVELGWDRSWEREHDADALLAARADARRCGGDTRRYGEEAAGVMRRCEEDTRRAD
jgi:hypothetical protein